MNESFIDFELFNIPESDRSESLHGGQLLVIVEKQEFEEHKVLLINILKAIGFTFGENVHASLLDQEESVNASQLVHENISHVLVFGLAPKRIGMNARFRANFFYPTETYKVLLTHKLSQLNADKKYKAALWQSIQNEFLK